MAYNAVTDFLALLRQTSGGPRMARVPGLDYVLAALARAGMFLLSVSATEPVTNQATTVWLKPFPQGSELGEGSVFLWNPDTLEFEGATPALWSAIFSAAAEVHLQDVAVVGPVDIEVHSDIVRVMNVGAPVTLRMPPWAEKVGNVLITDWANLAGTNPITITLEDPADRFPGGLTTWVLAGDGASVFLRAVPGGYAL